MLKPIVLFGRYAPLIILIANVLLGSTESWLFKTVPKGENKQPHDCLPPVPGDNWLYSWTGITGLCNQLSAVYAAVPTALVLNASLIVGPMYSRKDFGLKHRDFHKIQSNHEVLPFSTFFDIAHYQQFWMRKRKLTIVDGDWSKGNRSHCAVFSQYGYKHQLLYRPRWQPFSDAEFVTSILNASRVPVPIPPRTVLQFKGVMGMMSLYDYYQQDPLTQKTKAEMKLVRG
jgi:hypothetical protein